MRSGKVLGHQTIPCTSVGDDRGKVKVRNPGRVGIPQGKTVLLVQRFLDLHWRTSPKRSNEMKISEKSHQEDQDATDRIVHLELQQKSRIYPVISGALWGDTCRMLNPNMVCSIFNQPV